MKRVSSVILAAFLALLTACIMPAQVFADSIPEYISEVKIFTGDYSSAASEGYTLLKDGNTPVDLNQKAGGGLGSKGDKAVYLGYKTTKDKSDAITDLALMNMKGGYDVAEYEALFDAYIKSQVTPLSKQYIAMLKEYRENMDSDNEYNKAKATYVHDILNKFMDDDTGKGLGDLFLNETKQELGDEYNNLSVEQKKEHADLITIISQSNGNATLLMQALLARACDTNEETVIDRFSGLTYDDLIDSTGLTPTDAEKQLAKLYDDGAQMLLESWEDLKDSLDGYDDAVNTVENYDENASKKAIDAFGKLNENSTEKEIEDVTKAYNEALESIAKVIAAGQVIAIHDKLADIEYGDGTLLDFFKQDYDEVDGDITVLYPLVASLTEGQKAGVEFISLKELLLMTLTDEEGYKDAEFDSLGETSIYDGVDRAIYNMGGVALTTDARRTGAIEKAVQDSEYEFSTWSYIGLGVSAAMAVCAIGSGIGFGIAKSTLKNAMEGAETTCWKLDQTTRYGFVKNSDFNAAMQDMLGGGYEGDLLSAQRTANIMKGLTIGFSVAFIIIAAVTVYLTYKDMQEFYNVEFTPIPHYMVDEKDIIGYNKKGEKVMLKNQSAYYKAVENNRTESDEMYKVLGTCADMNGDVGQQWLALYAVKKYLMEPILASSLKVVVGSAAIPAGYETGIHMFGTDVAFNLNSNLYDWAKDAPAVYVYFKTDDTAASTTGTNFSGGTLALTGGAGVALGAVATALAMNTAKKKKENKAVSA